MMDKMKAKSAFAHVDFSKFLAVETDKRGRREMYTQEQIIILILYLKQNQTEALNKCKFD